MTLIQQWWQNIHPIATVPKHLPKSEQQLAAKDQQRSDNGGEAYAKKMMVAKHPLEMI